MTAAVVTALTPLHEASVATALEAAPGVRIIRRCADLAELLSTGAAGVADWAVVSPDLRGLDRDALRHLAGHGVRVAGVVDRLDEPGERRLRQLGVRAILYADATGPQIGAVLEEEGAGSVLDDGWLGAGGEEPAPGAPLGESPLTGIRSPLTAGVTPPPSDPDATGGLHSPDDRGTITAVWGPTGAPGRTTVAVTLAATLCAAGRRVLVVDLDTWGGSVAQVLGLLDEAPGVVAAARLSEQGTLDVVGLARVSPEVSPGLRVLTGLPRADRWPELRVAAVEDLLAQARLLVDHVVVDCGFALENDEELSYDTAAPRRNAATLAALEAADHLVVVGAADPVGLQRLVRAVQEVAVVPSPRPVVVVNKVRSSVVGAHPERLISQVLGRFAGLEDLHFLPWAPEECDAALLAGRSLVEQAPLSPITRAMTALMAVIDPSLADPTRRRGARRASGSGRARIRWRAATQA